MVLARGIFAARQQRLSASLSAFVAAAFRDGHFAPGIAGARLPSSHVSGHRSQLQRKRKDQLEFDNPYDVGMTGLIGHASSLVNEAAAGDAIFTADTGMCTVWGGSIPPNAEGTPSARVLHHGSMANALPQAIGAQFLYLNRQLVAFCGDGGLGMLMGDLLTLAQYDLPIKVVVFNNSTLGMVKLERT